MAKGDVPEIKELSQIRACLLVNEIKESLKGFYNVNNDPARISFTQKQLDDKYHETGNHGDK